MLKEFEVEDNSIVLICKLDGVVYEKGIKLDKETLIEEDYKLPVLGIKLMSLINHASRTIELKRKIGYWNPKFQKELNERLSRKSA